MKKLLFVLTVLLCLSACGKKTVENPVFNGRVLDANMSVIALESEGDTVYLRIYDLNELPGVFIGDSVNVNCDMVQPADGSETYYIARSIDFIKCDPAHLVDTWIETVEGQEEVQGFTLNDDGTAHTVGSSALRVKSWSIDDNGNLVLKTRIRGAGLKSTKYITYRIAKLDADSLILEDITSGEKDWVMSNNYNSDEQ